MHLANGQEIDLIIDRPGRPLAVIEIKSTTTVKEEHTKIIRRLGPDFGKAELFLLSRDREPKKFDSLQCLHWQEGIEAIIPKVAMKF